MVVQLVELADGLVGRRLQLCVRSDARHVRRASSSFGPLFAERAATIGRGRFSAGFNYQHARYDQFEGSDLDDGTIKFYLRHQECCTTGGSGRAAVLRRDESPTARCSIRSSRGT